MERSKNKPSLFGIVNSNVDLSLKDSWGKNKFNNTFPVSLCCYMEKTNRKAVFIKVNKNEQVLRDTITIEEIMGGISTLDEEINFNFESEFPKFKKYWDGKMHRNDLVVFDNKTSSSTLEIKLTALPDHTTSDLSEDKQSCEIVVRPSSICYLACSIAENSNIDVDIFDERQNELVDWRDESSIIKNYNVMKKNLVDIIKFFSDNQKGFLLQPIFKTIGKSSRLAEHCLDVFCWSDYAMLKFIIHQAGEPTKSINRYQRTVIWLYKMLKDLLIEGRCDFNKILNNFTFGTKNDKAFAANGLATHSFLKCDRLTRPIITKNEIKNIILNGGEELLSPERRFDALIFNSTDIFNNE